MKAKQWLRHYIVGKPCRWLVRVLLRYGLKVETKSGKRISMKAGDLTIHELDTDHFYGVRRRRVEAVAAAVNQMSRRSAYYKRLIAAEIDEIFIMDVPQRYFWLHPAKSFVWSSKDLDRWIGFDEDPPENVRQIHCQLIELAVMSQERRRDMLRTNAEIRPKIQVAIDDYYGIHE